MVLRDIPIDIVSMSREAIKLIISGLRENLFITSGLTIIKKSLKYSSGFPNQLTN